MSGWIAFLIFLSFMVIVGVIRQKMEQDAVIKVLDELNDLVDSGLNTNSSTCNITEKMLPDGRCVSSCPSGTTAGTNKICKCNDTSLVYDYTNSACQINCSAGYVKENGYCKKCGAGTKTNAVPGTTCDVCPIGTYSADGSTTCTPCPIGTFAPYTSSKTCIPCSTSTTLGSSTCP